MKELAKDNLKILKHIIGYVILLLVIVIACLIVKYNFMSQIQILDNNVFNYIKDNLISDKLTNVMKIITLFGSAWILIPLALISFIVIKNKKYGLLISMNLLWVFLLNRILKELFDRVRPISQFMVETGSSFPSSHTMCSVAFYGFLAVLINTKLKNRWLKVLVCVLFAILVVLIAISRMYLQVHYFTDVLLGLVFGLICLGMFISILSYVIKEK